MKKKIKKSVYVKIKLINGEFISGYLNMAGYDRIWYWRQCVDGV